MERLYWHEATDEADGLGGACGSSAELGRDAEQVQAAGGNTSLKANGTLWVKARVCGSPMR